MTFANLSSLWVVTGLVALAGILYLLQHLRVRFQKVDVATLIFWREVLDDSPVRNFWQKFRNWWAYLLILLICSFIWLAFAEPEWKDDGGKDFYILLLDGSANMARGNRYAKVTEELKQDLQKISSTQRQVIWCGETAKTLLNPGEHSLMLEKRLEFLKPVASPASIEHYLQQLASSQRDKYQVKIRVYGDSPISESFASLLSDEMQSMDIGRASSQSIDEAGNSGITALGVAETSSGEWGKLDALFRIEGDDSFAPTLSELTITIDDVAIARKKVQLQRDGKTYRLSDIDANGGLLKVKITKADQLIFDDTAEIRLPMLEKIRVQLSNQLSNDLKSVFKAVLSADNAIELVTNDADVVIRRTNEVVGGDKPALEISNKKLQSKAFQIGYPSGLNADMVLQQAISQTGLSGIDATNIANKTKSPVEVSVKAGKTWRMSLWESLLTPEYNFIQSRSFPLMIAQSVRWLAGIEHWQPYLAAGQPMAVQFLGSDKQFINAKGRLLDTLNAGLIPLKAGEMFTIARDKPLKVSLLNSHITRGQIGDSLPQKEIPVLNIVSEKNSFIWLLLLVITLLAVEWFLYQKGRMP